MSLERERALKPKDSFKECDKCPEVVVVPAGAFTMGSPESEKDREKTEGPQHRVTFAKPFAVGRFPVTFVEWDACVAAGGCNGYKPADEGWGRGNRPVINVNWNDAKTYVAWLSKKTGKIYRLLSEAEREYVTRAGTTTPFWFGPLISTQQANYMGDSDRMMGYKGDYLIYTSGAKGEDRDKTMPVNSFSPNPWGLYQTHGNVWEWVEDCISNNFDYNGTPSDGSALMSGICDHRILRGGAFVSSPNALRSAHRSTLSVDTREFSMGFRVARTLGN